MPGQQRMHDIDLETCTVSRSGWLFHPRPQRRARPRREREEVRGVLFLLTFLFLLAHLCLRMSVILWRHVPPAPPASSSPPPPFAPATRAGGDRRPVGRRAPHRGRSAATAVAQERPVSAEGKSMVAPGPPAPAPSGHRAASLSWLSSVPVGRSSSHATHHGCDEGRQPAPLRRSVARAEASSATVAPSSASRRSLRHHQP